MLQVAVCDDMPIECAHIANQLRGILKNKNIKFTIKKYFSGQELVQSKESFDLIFLDIKMPEISGMELAKRMRKQGKESLIIFITSAREYVFDAYDVEAFQYLMKPVGDEKLKTVLDKAVNKLQRSSRSDFLILSENRQTKKVLLRDILYIESVGRIAKFHCKYGVLQSYERLGELEDKLSEKHFFRCHKCFLVNLECVDTFRREDIVLENGETVILAKRRREKFERAILSYMKKEGGIL